MHSILKAVLIVMLLILPTLAVSASDAKPKVEAAPASNDALSVAIGANLPMKFSQQIVTGNLPEWKRLTPTYADLSPLPVRGQAMYYNPGIMQKVIAYRQRSQQIDECADCIGYVALLRAGDINRKIWLQVSADTVEGPFLVVDVAARHDIPRLLRIGWGIDVDWETAKRWNMRMPMVTILDAPPVGMMITSSAAWRASLAGGALQFNEIAPWTPIQTPNSMPIQPPSQTMEKPAIPAPLLVPISEVKISEVKISEVNTAVITDHPQAKPPVESKGILVNNMVFKPGKIEIKLERQN